MPRRNVGVAVLANRNLTLLPEAVRAFVLEQYLGPAETDSQAEIAERAAIIDALFTPQEPPTDPAPPSLPLDAYAGSYESDLHGRAVIVRDGDVLHIELGPAGYPAALLHFSHETFLLRLPGATTVPDPTTFVVGPDGAPLAFETEGYGRFDRVEPVD